MLGTIIMGITVIMAAFATPLLGTSPHLLVAGIMQEATLSIVASTLNALIQSECPSPAKAVLVVVVAVWRQSGGLKHKKLFYLPVSGSM